MTATARRVTRSVGGYVTDLEFATIIIGSTPTHVHACNRLSAQELDVLQGPFSVGRPYLFRIRAVLDVRETPEGLQLIAMEQIFNWRGGNYTSHAKPADESLKRHRFNLHDARGTYEPLTDKQFSGLMASTSGATAPFVAMDGSIHELPWGCLRVTVHMDNFRSRTWSPGITRA